MLASAQKRACILDDMKPIGVPGRELKERNSTKKIIIKYNFDETNVMVEIPANVTVPVIVTSPS